MGRKSLTATGNGFNWTKDKDRLLLRLYKERQVLWNNKLEEYTNVAARKLAMSEIADRLKAKEEIIKKRLNILRTQFNTNLRSQGVGGKVHSFSYYNDMKFLKEVVIVSSVMPQKRPILRKGKNKAKQKLTEINDFTDELMDEIALELERDHNHSISDAKDEFPIKTPEIYVERPSCFKIEAKLDELKGVQKLHSFRDEHTFLLTNNIKSDTNSADERWELCCNDLVANLRDVPVFLRNDCMRDVMNVLKKYAKPGSTDISEKSNVLEESDDLWYMVVN